MATCRECGDFFEQKGDWMTRCYECWKTLKARTTPFAESKHPALLADRDWVEPEPGNADPEHVRQCLAEIKAMLQ